MEENRVRPKGSFAIKLPLTCKNGKKNKQKQQPMKSSQSRTTEIMKR